MQITTATETERTQLELVEAIDYIFELGMPDTWAVVAWYVPCEGHVLIGEAVHRCSIGWECLPPGPGGNAEVGRRRFDSRVDHHGGVS
jgi:hypothetical protein